MPEKIQTVRKMGILLYGKCRTAIRLFQYYIIRRMKIRFLLLHSKYLQEFLRAADKPRIVLLDTPAYGNMGDQAIAIAEKQFLKLFFPENRIYEFTHLTYLSCEKEIVASLSQNDIVLIQGGGFIGSLWKYQEKVFLRILRKLRTHKITVFPQTAFFESSKKGEAVAEKFRQTVAQCSDLCLFAREQNTYDYLTKKMGMSSEQCICVPDIVTFLHYSKTYERMEKVLLCLRHDHEKTMGVGVQTAIEKALAERNLDFTYTDTVINQSKIYDRKREELVQKKLDEFAQCKLIITDRLHGMLLAAITGTPCLFMDNCSRKVSGTYEWIKDLEYVKPLKDIDFMNAFIDSICDGELYHYRNGHLQMYYEKMVEIIGR